MTFDKKNSNKKKGEGSSHGTEAATPLTESVEPVALNPNPSTSPRSTILAGNFLSLMACPSIDSNIWSVLRNTVLRGYYIYPQVYS